LWAGHLKIFAAKNWVLTNLAELLYCSLAEIHPEGLPMSKAKPEDDVGVTTIQVPRAVKKVLALEKIDRTGMSLGDLVTEAVIEKYGNDPRYRKILKESGLIE
jgi:hypothetical protein